MHQCFKKILRVCSANFIFVIILHYQQSVLKDKEWRVAGGISNERHWVKIMMVWVKIIINVISSFIQEVLTSRTQ